MNIDSSKVINELKNNIGELNVQLAMQRVLIGEYEGKIRELEAINNSKQFENKGVKPEPAKK